MLELGSRAGGNMIPVQLSDASGCDLVAANVLCAMGEHPGNIAWDSSECDGAFATYVLHSGIDGAFCEIEKSDAICQHVYREVIYKEPGDSVEAFDGANKALGIEFLRFADKAEMDYILGGISSEIHPVVEAS